MVSTMNSAVLLMVIMLYFDIVHSDQVCYPPYGCFSDDAPYDEALVQLPWGPKDLETKFWFYTRKDLSKPTGEIKEFDAQGASKVGFDPHKTTVFLTHGYIENSRRWWVKMFINELLNYENMNLIFVEWHVGSAFPYHQAVGNTRMVGAQVAHMIELIKNDTGINWDKLRLIGFSLGAHVMGYAGRNLRRKGMLLRRISALDPASPYFENKHPDRRIDPTDAEFVDVIHTDAKTLVVNGFGTTQEMGHIDFFPNGGFDQVGCGNLDVSVVQYLACSHYRVLRYYMESINSPCPYYGYPCQSYEDFKNGHCTHCPDGGCPRMGYHVARPKKDLKMKYYTLTNENYPFCAYHYSIEFYTGQGFLNDLDGTVTVELTGSKQTVSVTLKGKYYRAGGVVRDIFALQQDIGDLKKIRISHDRILDIWYLKGIVVRLMSTEKTYIGCYNKWLNTSQNQVTLIEGGEVDQC
ncbi:pancreatic triacylglycerol lipase-like [Clytia hemisphaerica]|uniref:PLAT domain-containing protein n=1 Tax=Clytia hemisphaerica TaxID=252671 RepID=A0A7M5XGN0_9CNID